MIVTVPEKYELPVSSPAPITSDRQHEHYLSVLEKLAAKEHPTPEEEKYAAVLLALIEAYEEAYHPVPDASPVEVLRALMGAHNPVRGRLPHRRSQLTQLGSDDNDGVYFMPRKWGVHTGGSVYGFGDYAA